MVATASRVFRAYASEDQNISAAVRELPSALRQTTRTLGEVERFAISETEESERRAGMLRIPGGFVIGYDRVAAESAWVPIAATRTIRFASASQTAR